MKVLHVCNVIPPKNHPDYARIRFHPGRWVLNLAQAQKRYAGIEPHIAMFVPDATQDFEGEVEGIPATFFNTRNGGRAASLFLPDIVNLRRKIRELNPAIVHGHGTEDANALTALHSGRPFVLTAQGLNFLINQIVPTGLISRRRLVEWIERYTLTRTRHIIAKSDYVGEHLQGAFPHLQIHRIPNTLDESLREIPPTRKEPNSIAFVGTVIERKGVHLICDAVDQLLPRIPDLQLHIYGDRGEEPGVPYVQEIRRRLIGALGKSVHFHGIVPGIEVACGVAAVQALVAPSLEEMFGNQLVEALAVGTHGIVTDQTAMAENVRRYGNGTVVPQQNATALAEAIAAALSRNDPAEATAARERVWEDLGPDQVARKHRALYEQILREQAAC